MLGEGEVLSSKRAPEESGHLVKIDVIFCVSGGVENELSSTRTRNER